MDERKQEMLQWVEKLEQYASDMGLSERIVDRVKECKDDLRNGNLREVQAHSEIEEVLESIRKKILSETAENDAMELELQMKKMAQRCHDENEKSIENMAERKNAVVKKCNMQIKEIVYTDTHMEELKHGARYVQFYEKAAAEFEKETSHLISEMLDDMNHNYSRMLEHMKSLLRKSGGEKAFYELELKRETIGKKIQANVEAWSVGKQEIISFAQKTGKKIGKIVKAGDVRRKLYTILPVLLLIFFFAARILLGIFDTSSDTETVAVETEVEQQEEFDLNRLADILSAGSEISDVNIFTEIGMLLIGIAGGLVVIVLYIFYIKWLKKRCNSSIARKSAEYLQQELTIFEQSDCLRLTLEEAIQGAAVEYEQQHTILLRDTFNMSDTTLQNEGKQRLIELIEEWRNGERKWII